MTAHEKEVYNRFLNWTTLSLVVLGTIIGIVELLTTGVIR